MGYYRGDGGNFYRGDYYRGDPFIGGLVAGAVGKAVGKAARWVGSRVSKNAGPIVRDVAPSTVAGAVGYTMGRNQPVLTGMPTLGPIGGTMPYRGGAGMPMTRRRRINPLNPKALRRALRRAEGFEKFAQRTVNSLYRVIDGRKVRTFKKRTRAS